MRRRVTVPTPQADPAPAPAAAAGSAVGRQGWRAAARFSAAAGTVDRGRSRSPRRTDARPPRPPTKAHIVKILDEFKEFAVRGNVINMAVGSIIGGAFGTIVSSAVEAVVMPPIGQLVGRVDFSDLEFSLGKKPEPVSVTDMAAGAVGDTDADVIEEGAEDDVAAGAAAAPTVAESASAAADGGAGDLDMAAIRYGKLLQACFDFLIVAIAVFLLVKAVNALRREDEKSAADADAPSPQEALLAEIRDLLKTQNRTV